MAVHATHSRYTGNPDISKISGKNIIFPIIPGNSFHAHTSRLFDWNEIHDQLWISRVTSHVEFAVRAAAEARIALAYEPTNTTGNFYEVILGSSSGSDVIVERTDEQGRKEELDRAMTSQVVHESYYKQFWIKWSDLLLTIG